MLTQPMIKAPKQIGNYSRRYDDCKRAIEPPAMMIVHGSRAPFIDFFSLLHAILPGAAEAGWEEEEVQSALEEFVRDMRPH